MRKIDNFIAALLNEEHERATELFSEYILERAQNIHEGLRRGEHPVLSEDIDDEIVAEQYFTDDDLADKDEDVAADTLSDEMGAEDADVDAGSEEMDADMSDMGDMGSEEDMDAEGDEAPVEVDDRLDDLEAQLDELTAEFERMMSEIDGEGTEDADIMGAENEVETDVDGEAETEKMEESDLSAEIGHDDEFPDISEAIIDELEKISTPNSDGREQGNKTISQQGKSLPSARDKMGKPITSKNVTHKGFDRETAPSSGRLPKADHNEADKAMGHQSSVAKGGDPKAEINKPVKQNNVSPVAKGKK